MKKKISIIIPYFNNLKYLPNAIESVIYQNLNQDTGGTFNASDDLANIPSAKKKSYKSDIDTSSNQRNILDD